MFPCDIFKLKCLQSCIFLMRLFVQLRSEEAHAMYKEALKYDQANPDIFYSVSQSLCSCF